MIAAMCGIANKNLIAADVVAIVVVVIVVVVVECKCVFFIWFGHKSFGASSLFAASVQSTRYESSNGLQQKPTLNKEEKNYGEETTEKKSTKKNNKYQQTHTHTRLVLVRFIQFTGANKI